MNKSLFFHIQKWALMSKLRMHQRMIKHYEKGMLKAPDDIVEDSNQYLWDYHINMALVIEKRLRDLEASN